MTGAQTPDEAAAVRGLVAAVMIEVNGARRGITAAVLASLNETIPIVVEQHASALRAELEQARAAVRALCRDRYTMERWPRRSVDVDEVLAALGGGSDQRDQPQELVTELGALRELAAAAEAWAAEEPGWDKARGKGRFDRALDALRALGGSAEAWDCTDGHAVGCAHVEKPGLPLSAPVEAGTPSEPQAGAELGIGSGPALSAPVETGTASRPPEIPGCDAVYGAEFWSPLPCRSFHGHEGMHADRYGRTWRDTEAAGTPAAEPAHDDLAEALDYLKGHLATDPRDWALGRRDAVLYALLVGWDCEELHDHDDICGGGTAAMDELAARYWWTAEFVATLRRRRRALAGAGAPTEPAADIPAEIISLARAIHEAAGDPHMSTFRRVMAALGMSYTVDITRDPDAPVALPDDDVDDVPAALAGSGAPQPTSTTKEN